ncbi:hypothetical protein H6P81_016968 [Aristolochia fimbriata]|uniref:Uncharacterized protein n=1 Tax=Aristolochia fimbriata TaxID=158543 RepID=A0AAV7DYM2_ARIFI|nr:hypothetical protein H6P81_016968 [Aristolochia fimbriata]
MEGSSSSTAQDAGDQKKKELELPSSLADLIVDQILSLSSFTEESILLSVAAWAGSGVRLFILMKIGLLCHIYDLGRGLFDGRRWEVQEQMFEMEGNEVGKTEYAHPYIKIQKTAMNPML